MKKLLVMAILGLTFSGIAQEKRELKHVEKPAFTSQQKNELQVKKLTLELDLNAQQQKDIAAIVGKQQMKREALRTEMKNNRAEKKNLTTDERFVLKKSILDDQIAYKSEMKKVLTAEQLNKWEDMRKSGNKRTANRMKNKKHARK
ncbi:hypothetical protein FLAN108750_05050 [Flavobacterium antarcticum]|uniref:hypothetical protein n=1 Tax=Flavobacterium antarcticum TaxID=271155 RepID=UPI0012F780DD|nr:hypothetical protein [Flavobacterium antarcticum]